MAESPLGKSTPAQQSAFLAEKLRLLVAPDQIVELRALDVEPAYGRPYTASGFFDSDHLHEMARLALATTSLARGVYFTLNPLNRDLLARRANRIDRAKSGETASDQDVLKRQWLLVDADPVRAAHISATDVEKEHAHAIALTARSFLGDRGWPNPILSDSGNGYHLLYKIDLPTADDGVVERILAALATQFDTPQAHIDRKVFNPSRICKLPWTLARKGDHTTERPHRRAKILNAEPVQVVPTELLLAMAGERPKQRSSPPSHPPSPNTAGNDRARLKVDEWLAARGVAFRVKPEPDALGRTVYVLARCPFDPAHGDPDACVMQNAEGKLSALCFHNSCGGKGWQAFQAAIGVPDGDHYEPPKPRRRRTQQRRTDDERGTALNDSSDGPPAGTLRDDDGSVRAPGKSVVIIDPHSLTVADTLGQITNILCAAGDCYRRADQLVRIQGTQIEPFLNAPELAGLLNRHAEVVLVNGNLKSYQPLPNNYANTWLHQPNETARLPAIALFTHCPVFTVDWRLAAPGYDASTGIYYAGTAIATRTSTAHLDALLCDFCFHTFGDRTNYVAVLLTAVLSPHFVGSKPAVLFNGNQPGVGKSILAQIIAILRDGRPVGTATYNSNDEEFEKRLGAIVRTGTTTIVIDNAKAGGRNPCIDSAVLERSITDTILSYRLLGYSREIRAENVHQFCLTANGPAVSPDLVSRSVVVNLFYEGSPRRRVFTHADPEQYAQHNRVEILGELLGLVERWRAVGSPHAVAASRFNKKGWGPIVGGILASGGYPDFLANAAAVADLDETRGEFAALVAYMADHTRNDWSAAELAEIAVSQGFFPTEFPNASSRGRATRIGLLAGRYVGERFPLGDGRSAVFRKETDRKGAVYRVEIETDELVI